MEEGLNYKTVTFINNKVSVYEMPTHTEVIYDEVKTEEHACDTKRSESQTKAAARPQLHLVAAGLGVACVLLLCTVVVLWISLNTVMSEAERENISLQRQKEELTKQRDRLNWTFEAVLEHRQFPVHSYCPQNGACQPCLDQWIQFQSNCYLFSGGTYSSKWKTWEESQNECKTFTANLLVIDSQDEQEFISNHTRRYCDDKHGYWIGLRNTGRWMWLNKWNLTVSYWRTTASSTVSCGLSLPEVDPLANWQNTGCYMKNRWICERRALIRPN
ncbi:natural killer cells antigen CD94 [Betta splendens]|uniref:Natural killer cells antigen CD94 n=1 Tax=Betta splendens TaxID=158456 RepID=A0A6P7KN72_BETSP|nr:natural killer cells antigen CD94 [Betta splendens]